jgi:Ca2+-binding EF-hand superfamily protein
MAGVDPGTILASSPPPPPPHRAAVRRVAARRIPHGCTRRATTLWGPRPPRSPRRRDLGGLWCEHAGYDALGGLASTTGRLRPWRALHTAHMARPFARRSALSSGAILIAVLLVGAATSKSVAEAAGATEAGAPTLDAADVQQLFDGIDTNGNGEINLMELRRGSAWLEQYDYSPSALKELLKNADRNGNRLLDTAELMHHFGATTDRNVGIGQQQNKKRDAAPSHSPANSNPPSTTQQENEARYEEE